MHMRDWYGPLHWWRSARPIIVVLIVICALAAWRLPERGIAWHEFGPRDAIAGLPESERIAYGVDLAHVHGTLLPRLWLAHQRLPGREQLREAAFDALYAELEPVPDWAAVAIAWRDVLRQPRPDPERLRGLEQRWNAEMTEAGMPWTVRTPLDPDIARFGHIALSYHVEADALAFTEAGPVRVIYGRRADRLNITEAYFGWANPRTTEAFITLDRVESFARVELWPLMSPDAARVDPRLSDVLREQVRTELSAALPKAQQAALVSSAAARARQLRVIQGIADRGACGEPPPLTQMAERSWDRHSLRALRAHLAPVTSDCPAVTSTEVARLQRAQQRLDRVPGVDAGIAELTYAAASVVAAHEIQHLVDHATGDLRGHDDVEHEVSAYLGAMERSATPTVGLLMACRVAQAGPPALRDAVSVALGRVDPTGCAGAPPVELRARAALARRSLLPETAPVAVSSVRKRSP